jgi:dihydroceramide fatty acyl 2-hydroxylase
VFVRTWKCFTPFFLYTAVAFFLGIAATVGEEPHKAGILLLLVSGFLSWGELEYSLHRFIFHFDAHSILVHKFVYAAHLSHHEKPRSTDDLFAKLRISLPVAAGYWLLAWAVLGWRAASYLLIGLIGGYFCYEWLHFQAHHARPRLRLFRYLKRYHLLHHYRTPGLRFGVTSPLFDLMFGTFQPVGDSPRPLDRK